MVYLLSIYYLFTILLLIALTQASYKRNERRGAVACEASPRDVGIHPAKHQAMCCVREHHPREVCARAGRSLPPGMLPLLCTASRLILMPGEFIYNNN